MDLNEEVKEEAPALEQIEEAPEQAPEPQPIMETDQRSIIVQGTKTANEVIEEAVEEQPAEEPKPKPKAKTKASDIVQCPDCFRSMTYKNLRYSHKCSPEPPPVKKQANPKAKQKPTPRSAGGSTEPLPKPAPEVYYSDSEKEEQQPAKPFIKKKQPAPQQIDSTTALAQHYQLLQQAFIKQKQEKYNNLCMNMFSSKSKKKMI